jgi:hypothetical protein
VELNRYLVAAMRRLHGLFSVDLDAPASTWSGTSFDERLRLAPHEDASGNPLHLCLYLVVMAMWLSKKYYTGIRWYAVSVMAGFLIFCILLRWQPWNSRLHLPLFVIFAPVAGTVIARLQRKWLVTSLVCLFSFAALPWVFCNVSRPLISLSSLLPGYPASILTVSRQSGYFANRPELERSYRDAACVMSIRGVKNIGLDTGGSGNSWEYPLWVLTRTRGLAGPRIEHMAVTNISRKISTQFTPDIIIDVKGDGKLCLSKQ